MADTAEQDPKTMQPEADDEMDSGNEDQGYASHQSRSQSRRRRRQNQRQRQSLKGQQNGGQQQANGPQAQGQAQSGDVKAQSQAMAPINEEQEVNENNAMQPFEWIGPDETSMDGPVTYAKAQRGEIPMRPGNPNQKLATAGASNGKSLDEQDGLKLKLEVNLDVEVELKAKIYGDLTIALL